MVMMDCSSSLILVKDVIVVASAPRRIFTQQSRDAGGDGGSEEGESRVSGKGGAVLTLADCPSYSGLWSRNHPVQRLAVRTGAHGRGGVESDLADQGRSRSSNPGANGSRESHDAQEVPATGVKCGGGAWEAARWRGWRGCLTLPARLRGRLGVEGGASRPAG